jgi:Periplasmic serine proteases (ClpP class)
MIFYIIIYLTILYLICEHISINRKIKKFLNKIRAYEKSNKCKLIIITDNFWSQNRRMEKIISKFVNDIIFSFDDYDEYLFMKICNNVTFNDKEIRIILHTHGGVSDTAESMCLILSQMKKVSSYIPYYAYSAGSYVALASKNIYMNQIAFMGPIDSQVDFKYDNNKIKVSNTDIVKLNKNIKLSKDMGLLFQTNEAKKNFNYDMYIIKLLLEGNTNSEKIIKEFLLAEYPHDSRMTYQKLKQLNLKNLKPFNDPDIMRIIDEMIKIQKDI